MKSAVTICLVPEARGGPFVFHDDLPAACRRAAELGFDAVELFPSAPEAVNPHTLRTLLDDYGLSLAAVGTGAGWVKHKLSLTAADEQTRERAIDFTRRMLAFAAPFGAPVVVGAMQGRSSEAVPRPVALRYLGHALYKLDEHADDYDGAVLYEPLNRYETDLVCTLGDGVYLLSGLAARRVRLLADLFHMNIEEADPAGAIRAAGRFVGHVHFADSNRRAAGMGHTDFPAVLRALRDIGYSGYLSAEVLPLPDPDTAARQTIQSLQALRD